MKNDVSLDLGGALAAFGLIFAVYQLRKESWILALAIRARWQQLLFWLLSAIGLLFTMIGVVIAHFPNSDHWPSFLGVPLIYDAIAYTAFICSPISLIYFSTNIKGLFLQNPERFYLGLINELARTSDDGINAVLRVLVANLDSICVVAATAGRTDAEHMPSQRLMLS